MAEIINKQTPIASYDYGTIARGINVENFYGGKYMYISGSAMVSGMILSNKVFYSKELTSKKNIATTGFSPGIDVDFDLSFGLPRTINGTILINIPQGFNTLSNVTNAAKLYLDIYLYKVDTSGTATLLVSGSTFISQFKPLAVNNDEAYSRIETIGLSLTNQKFKKNEKLRMNVKQFVAAGNTNTIIAGIGHDPANRDDNNEGEAIVAGSTGPVIQNNTEGTDRFQTDTNLIMQIPFKIDI
jgi:hypothetical protein